jgi:tetraacyldisaccharide 4'-kinase
MNPLSPIGWLYGLGTTVRNALYDRGLIRVHNLGAKTISIGNITAGGTGKTPLTALVAEMLAGDGEKVCILTRGYGRKVASERVLVSDGEKLLADAATGGDEPVELAKQLIGKAVVVADRDRVAAAEWAREKFGSTAFVLDDGFQHRRARRDLDIVCIDAADPFGGGEVLPAGLLREPERNLKRAAAIVITRSNLVASTDDLAARIRSLNPTATIFTAFAKMSAITPLSDFLEGTKMSADHSVMRSAENGFLFCALGSPESLRKQLTGESFHLAGFRDFSDHHIYTRLDIRNVEAEAERLGASVLLTTGKDAVKLAGIDMRMPCFVISSSVEISDVGRFRELITSL